MTAYEALDQIEPYTEPEDKGDVVEVGHVTPREGTPGLNTPRTTYVSGVFSVDVDDETGILTFYGPKDNPIAQFKDWHAWKIKHEPEAR